MFVMKLVWKKPIINPQHKLHQVHDTWGYNTHTSDLGIFYTFSIVLEYIPTYEIVSYKWV